jgi:hypothetical protein
VVFGGPVGWVGSRRPELVFSEKAERGFLESDFLLHIISGKEEMEPYDQDCNCVKVWPVIAFSPTQTILLSWFFVVPL